MLPEAFHEGRGVVGMFNSSLVEALFSITGQLERGVELLVIDRDRFMPVATCPHISTIIKAL